VVESLLCKSEALSSNSRPTKKKKIKDILLIPNSQTPQSFQDENMDPRGTRGLLDYHKDIILGANLLKGDYKRG
jgi:hypothetical protein